jgi:hypothetical protein
MAEAATGTPESDLCDCGTVKIQISIENREVILYGFIYELG